jgi:oligogalacturonide lyase
MPLDWNIPKWSRRSFVILAAGIGGAAQTPTNRPEWLPSEWRRYVDGATEFLVVRLTDPAHNSYLTAPWNRGVSGRNFLLYSNDSGGALDVYRTDLKTGQHQRLTEAGHLDPASIALVPGDRGFVYIDGAMLRHQMLSNLRDRELYAAAAPFDRLGPCAIEHDGSHVCVVESKSGKSRVRLVHVSRGSSSTALETEDEITMVLPRPGGGFAYRVSGSIRFRGPSGQDRPLAFAAGGLGPVYWSPDGNSLLYLNFPERPGELNNIREFVLASGKDRMLAKTTQFVQFAPNSDATVFVGASGSKASPHVLILLRSVARELTLCEHRARDPRSLAVVFSPNSQRVFFQSDQLGKPAIYSIPVERFVEETES